MQWSLASNRHVGPRGKTPRKGIGKEKWLGIGKEKESTRRCCTNQAIAKSETTSSSVVCFSPRRLDFIVRIYYPQLKSQQDLEGLPTGSYTRRPDIEDQVPSPSNAAGDSGDFRETTQHVNS